MEIKSAKVASLCNLEVLKMLNELKHASKTNVKSGSHLATVVYEMRMLPMKRNRMFDYACSQYGSGDDPSTLMAFKGFDVSVQELDHLPIEYAYRSTNNINDVTYNFNDIPVNFAYRTIYYYASQYLQNLNVGQTEGDVRNLLTALSDFPVQLTYNEKLMIVNTLPRTSLELSLLINGYDDRLTEEQIQDLLEIIAKNSPQEEDS